MIRIFIITFFLFFLIVGKPYADAPRGYLEWQRPTEWTDGSALDPAQITAWGFQCDGVAGELVLPKDDQSCTNFVKTDVNTTDCISTAENGFPATGIYTCRVRAFSGIIGGEWSNDVTVNFTPGLTIIPAAPLNLR